MYEYNCIINNLLNLLMTPLINKLTYLIYNLNSFILVLKNVV